MLIAEIGSVHDGSFGNAKKLINLAKKCGADAVKFQTHIAEAESTKDAPSPSYFSEEQRYDYFLRTSFSIEQWNALREYAGHMKILFISSPFSLEAVDLLEEVGLEIIKIPSGELSNTPLLERIRDRKKKILLSTGMSTWAEIDEAMNVLKGEDVTLMQCSSIYPCPLEKVGLNVISEMKVRYGVEVGFSDHTEGCEAALAAKVFGATVIEKHLTFSKEMYGSDAKNAMEPVEFSNLALMLHRIEKILENKVNKNDIEDYEDMRRIFMKGIYARMNIECGEKIGRTMLCYKKPLSGIPASQVNSLVGKTALNAIIDGQAIDWSDVK